MSELQEQGLMTIEPIKPAQPGLGPLRQEQMIPTEVLLKEDRHLL
jgi:hypothetical protein